MSTFRYRKEDLLLLRQSPRVTKPENLPSIHQWIDTPNDQRKQRKNEEVDDAKRLSLAHTRNRQSQSGEIFLGPKISFASVSAARQPKEERSVSDELKAKVERIGRDRTLHDRTGDRCGAYREYPNGQADGNHSNIRSGREANNEDNKLKQKARQRQMEDDDHRTSASKRTGIPDKINRSWFRASNEQSLEHGYSEKRSEGTGRNGWGKENRQDHASLWLGERLVQNDEPEAQTQQDFVAWKEAMKKEYGPKGSASQLHEKDEPVAGLEEVGDQIDTLTTDQPLFGLWGQSEGGLNQRNASKKPSKPIKVSRFFSAGAQKSAPEQLPQAESPDSPIDSNLPDDDENRRGFQNIMQMLRAGGPATQTQVETQTPLSATHQSLHLHSPPLPTISYVQDAEQPPSSTHGPHKSLESPDVLSHDQTPSTHLNTNRDAEFLINLMKQQRPRFQEGQIYGRNYEQRQESDDGISMLNEITTQEGKASRHHPGFRRNQHAFSTNNDLDISACGPPKDKPPEEHFPSYAVNEANSHIQAQYHSEFQFPPRHSGDFGTRTSGPHQRPSSHDNIAPPPGFPSSRPSLPPGFSPYGMASSVPPHMRVPPPMHFNGPPAPGFGPQPPPGINHQPAGRRIPGQNVPPGFEMYVEVPRRQGAPVPLPTQYMNQSGGPAAY